MIDKKRFKIIFVFFIVIFALTGMQFVDEDTYINILYPITIVICMYPLFKSSITLYKIKKILGVFAIVINVLIFLLAMSRLFQN